MYFLFFVHLKIFLQRYILKIPFNFNELAADPKRVYELQIHTGKNTGGSDLLVKLTGSHSKSPILWLRNTFDGSLKYYFVDVVNFFICLIFNSFYF